MQINDNIKDSIQTVLLLLKGVTKHAFKTVRALISK